MPAPPDQLKLFFKSAFIPPLNNPKGKLYKLSKKYYIIIFTARYMGRNNDNVKLAKKQGYELTYKQLVQWNLKFDKLLMGKPSYDFIIDDKGYGFKKNWYQNFKLKD